MLRPSSLPRALAVVAAVAVACLGAVSIGPAAGAAAAPVDPTQPLVPRMRSITPDYVPDHGPIVIRGTLTNRSTEEWTAINVHGFIGPAPMTTSAELAAAVRTPVADDVGHRITATGTFDSIPKLEPGQTTTFVVRIPRSQLPVSAPGVYWFGVHVLGATAQGRTNTAVGRDRTFIPLVPQSDVASGLVENTALVVPVRAGVTRASDGSIEDPSQWLTSLRSGALHDAVQIGRAAGGRPLTWMVDPAVPDVVRRLAAGNPPRTLASPQNPPGGPSASPSASPSTSSTADVASGSSTTRVSKGWLHDLHQVLTAGTGEILGLPYGDVAVDTAARYDQALLDAAFRRTGHQLKPWGLPLGRVVAPPDGRMAATTTTGVPSGADILLDEKAVAGGAPPGSTVNGRRIVLASSDAAQGGPGPVAPLSSLALRQRILSEAALRFLDQQQPLVVVLPTGRHHPLLPSFFSGLEVPWLHLTTVDGAASGSPTPLSPARLHDPVRDGSQLGPRLYVSGNRLLADAATLQSVLFGNHVLVPQVFAEATGNASYAASEDPYGALARMRSAADWVTHNLQGIDVAAPESVTLASASGRFSALVSNQLDVPVTVTVRALADPRLHITGGETVQLPPHGRTTVLLNASTHVLGVHTVTLLLTNQAGQPLGARDQFPMRAEQVSRLIWVIIGAGVCLLFAAIVVRLVRRILGSRAS